MWKQVPAHFGAARDKSGQKQGAGQGEMPRPVRQDGIAARNHQIGGMLRTQTHAFRAPKIARQ